MAIAPQDASNTTDSSSEARQPWLALIEQAGDDSLGSTLIRLAKLAAGAHRAEAGHAAASELRDDAIFTGRVRVNLLRGEVER